MLIGGLSVAVAACSAPAQAPAPRDKDGATTIPREPTRVVTVGLSDHDYVLALGVVPVGLTDWYGDQHGGVWPWARAALGTATPEVMPRNDDQLDVSEERLDLLDRDLLVWNAGFSPELRGVLGGNPLYQRLSVVRDKRVLFLEDANASGTLTWSTVLSLPYAIDTVTPQLASTLAGNGNG